MRPLPYFNPLGCELIHVASWLQRGCCSPLQALRLLSRQGERGTCQRAKKAYLSGMYNFPGSPTWQTSHWPALEPSPLTPSSCKVAVRRGFWGGLAHGWHVSRSQSPTQCGPRPSNGHPLGTTISHNHNQRWSSAWMTGKLVVPLQASQRLTSMSQVLLPTFILILINPLKTEDTLLSIFTCRHSTALHLVCA